MVTAEEVRAGLRRGELFVEYLPTVSLADAHCIGAEALIRWKVGSHIRLPGEFVPAIEGTPASGTLTYWVMDTVASELGDWLDQHSGVHISINVPPEILGRGGLEYAAVSSGLIARVEKIVLEITERGIPDGLGLLALEMMARRGVRVALDDTMLSGANLALLTRCNFGMIKLDRALVAQLVEHAPEPEWLRGLTSLLAGSSLQVVAEGVESMHQADVLLRAGVQLAQGHLFSTSLRAREFVQFHARDRAPDWRQ